MNATSASQQLTKLKKENERLKREVAKLEKLSSTPKPKRQTHRWRSLSIILAGSLAAALLVVGNVMFWTGRTLIDTERYSEVTAPLIQNPTIQTAIANKTTDELFSTIDVEQLAVDALPEQAKFLAPSLALQVEKAANTEAKNILANEKFQDTWIEFNVNSHARLINFIRNYEGDGSFNLSDLFNKVTEQLSGGKLSFLQGKQLPASIGNIQIVSAPNLPKAHWIVVNLWWVRLLTIAMFVGLTTLAVGLAKKKRAVLVKLSILYGAMSFITLITIRIGRAIAVSKVTPEYQDAATATWQIILNPLVLQTAALVVAFTVIGVIAWVTGSGNRATKVRSTLGDIVNGKIHQTLFKHENAVTKWVLQNKKMLQIIALVLAGIGLLVIRLNPLNIALLSLALLLVIGIIEVFSARK